MKYLNDAARLVVLMRQMLDGLSVSLGLFALTLLFALPLGLLLALLRMSRSGLLSKPAAFYILVMRGTPLILQVFTVYFFLPVLLRRPFDRMAAAALAFSLNYAAYFAEIYRGGVQSIPRGQREAAQVLGMGRAQAFLRVILPQVIKRIVLPISNEVITLVKDTALVTAIGMVELFRVARNAASAVGSLEPLFIAGLVYLLLNTLISWLFDRANRYFEYYKG